MSKLMEDTGHQVGTGEFTERMPTLKEELAMKILHHKSCDVSCDDN